MSKPKIAVCRNNHVYNAALYTECPICLKKSTFGGSSAAVTGRIPGSYAYDHGGGDPEDRTVNLFDSTVDNRNVHVSESSRRGPASVSTGSHSLSGPSVRSYSSSSSSRKPRQRCLAGWLVFLENLLILSFWAFIGNGIAVIFRNSALKTKPKEDQIR